MSRVGGNRRSLLWQWRWSWPAGRSSSCGGYPGEESRWTPRTLHPAPAQRTEDTRHMLLIYRRTEETYRAVKRDLHDSWSDTRLLWQEVSGWCWDSPRAECRSDTAQSPAELQARHRALNTEPSPAPGGASPPAEGKHDRFYSESHSIWKPLLLFIIYADIKRNWGVRSSDVCVLPCWWHSWRLRRTQSPSPAPPGRRWRWSARWHTNTNTHISVGTRSCIYEQDKHILCLWTRHLNLI